MKPVKIIPTGYANHWFVVTSALPQTYLNYLDQLGRMPFEIHTGFIIIRDSELKELIDNFKLLGVEYTLREKKWEQSE
jgi:phosphosulfolactate synthase (CoM biosynthesis protein A)